MGEIVLRGMTWAHRRAVDPLLATLAAFRGRCTNVTVEWDSRPLAGFEFTPVDELAARYDLVILDHPFAGEIAATGCLRPLDALAGAELERAFVGPSLASYRYDGRLWALPVDAACQVAVYRPDLLARLDEAVPESWADALALAERAAAKGLRPAIALSGVHALMTFFSLTANLGRPCGSEPDAPFVDREAAGAALDAMRRLVALAPPEVLDWNSIALQDAMAARDDLVYCPAVYGFATYAEPGAARPLAFADFAGLRAPYASGSTLGGAGLGLSARSAEPEAAFAYARFLAEAETQRAFAAHHGQPARVEVWEDAASDARFGGFYRATRASIENAWVRPRYPGYLAFQREAGSLVERHLRGELGEDGLLTALEALHGRAGGRRA